MGKNETVLERKNSSEIRIDQKSDFKKEDAVSKIETIRDLIFGENIEEYNSEFESLKNDILKKKKDLEALIDEIGKDLRTAIDNVDTDVNVRITELEDKLGDKIDRLTTNKVDKNSLGKMLIDLGEKLSQK